MRPRIILLALLCGLAAPANAKTLADVHFMRGCWRSLDGQITEVWSAPPPMPAMLGFEYMLRDGHTREWEHTRIELRDGKLVYVAMPDGANPTFFTEAPDDRRDHIAFDNPEHDFPKRVEYWREGRDLMARVSGDGHAVDYHYRPIRCPRELLP